MSKSPLSGLNVLVLEDELLLRKRLAGFLEKEGASVTAVGTVGAARQAAESLPFDVALLDVNLPDGRGTDLLRDKVFSATTNVLVMTAEGGVAGAVEAVRAGASDYLVKPFDSDQVTALVDRLLARAESATATAPVLPAGGMVGSSAANALITRST